ncbi:MAG: alpha/beta fold hydrolase [Acidimicrobiales bacterium]
MAWRVRTADGVEIAVGVLGGPSGGGAEAERPVVVMAHATGFCGDVLGPVAAALTPEYECVGFDARGHGRSGLPPEHPGGWQRWDWHGFGLDVLAVVDWVANRGAPGPGTADRRGGPGPASHEGGPGTASQRGGPGTADRRGGPGTHGFGHSCGAAALLLAEIARPGTFAAIYTFEPVVFRPPPAGVLEVASPLADMTRRRREVFESAAEAYANFASKGPFSAFDPAVLAAYVDCGFEHVAGGGVRLACRREHEAFIYEAGLAHDAWDHLGEIACPVTVAYGQRSDFMGEDDATALASRIPHGRVVEVGGVGHFGPMERPGEVATSVLAAFGSGVGAGFGAGVGAGVEPDAGSVRDLDTPLS